jgi:photosystem II stability/assembly factor-like uncharacterized protein
MSLFFQRVGMLAITGVAILSLAASCSIPNPFEAFAPSPKTPVALGILKHDPAIKAEGFGKINKTISNSANENDNGLENSQIAKLIQTGTDEWWALSWNTGLYQTKNGGRSWSRLPIFSLKDKEGDDYTRAVTANNSFGYGDVTFANNYQDVYVSGQSTDKLGKIYKSTNGGADFAEVFSDINSGSRIRRVVVDAALPTTVYAVQENQMLYSRDSGATWTRWTNLNGKVVQMGAFADKRTFALTDGGYLFTFADKKGKTPESSSLQLKIKGGSLFSSGGQYIEQSKKDPTEFLVVAGNALWLTRGGVEKEFEKLILPTASESTTIITATMDPKLGAEHLIVSVNNRLYESSNRGTSWKTDTNLGLESQVGSIGVIAIDRDKTDTIYLGLIK